MVQIHLAHSFQVIIPGNKIGNKAFFGHRMGNKTRLEPLVLLSKLKTREPSNINDSLFMYILTMYLQLRRQRLIGHNIMVGRELI